MKVDFERLEEIPRTSSGKLRVSVSKLDPHHLAEEKDTSLRPPPADS
jgi:hypothetical protein